MYSLNIISPLFKKSLGRRFSTFQKVKPFHLYPAWPKIRNKSTLPNDDTSETFKSSSGSEKMPLFPWLYDDLPDRAFYPKIKVMSFRPGILPRIFDMFFRRPYYGKLAAIILPERRLYFMGEFQVGAEKAFKVLCAKISTQDITQLEPLASKRLFDRYSKALADLKAKNYKVRILVKEVYKVNIRDVRVTFGAKDVMEKIPESHFKLELGFVNYIYPECQGMSMFDLLDDTLLDGAIFKVDAVIDADIQYSIESPSGYILNTHYARNHVITLTTPHMKPSARGVFSNWKWLLDDVDFLLETEQQTDLDTAQDDTRTSL